MALDVQTRTSLAVPRTTGTPGDDLVAWGLSHFAAALSGEDVDLRVAGDHFAVEIPVSPQELLDRTTDAQPHAGLNLFWLASPENGRVPPPDITAHVDRDRMRDEYKRLREAWRRGARIQEGLDGPAVVTATRAERYPLYLPLTSPSKQWSGYNALVELVHRYLLCPQGLALVLFAFDADTPLDYEDLDRAMRKVGLGKRGDRWRNPPGFLYPGLNKGPTMRLTDRGGPTLGQANLLDWMLVNRGDRSLIELYLAYLGYFAVARAFDHDSGRVVLVPAPTEVTVPETTNWLQRATPTYSTIDDYLLASTALAYSTPALEFWEDHAVRSRRARFSRLLTGVHVSIFWKPNANTFAGRRQSMALLPSWLPRIHTTGGYDQAKETVDLHQRRLRRLRGPQPDEGHLPQSCRDAITAYTTSMGGDLAAWFRAVALWTLAARDVTDGRVHFWRTDDVRRIVMALDPNRDILSIIDDERFQHLAAAIRSATVYAQIADAQRRRNGGGPTLAFEPDYDLLTSLGESADRQPGEFLELLFQFVAHYNDETLRRNQEAVRRGQTPRAVIRTEDLRQVAAWVLADRRGLVPAALLAFGSSLPPKAQAKDEAVQAGAESDSVDSVLESEIDLTSEERMESV